ncbi:MAG: PIG-L family deacetylase [Armatimonadetes bacterium]|nr:PIG-L family deacetylase [Armatimonadota bacterium]
MTESVPSILAVGAHTGDAEVSMGAVIARHARAGGRATICHLTLGEGGHPSKPPEVYGPQRQEETKASARILGCDVVWFPFADIGFAGGPECLRMLVELIRKVKPDVVLSHWPGSLHSGHNHAGDVTLHAVEVAGFRNPAFEGEPHRVKAVYCPENWEDPFHFVPALYLDVSDVIDVWEKSCLEHELFQGAPFFPYLQYYKGAMSAHGARVRCRYAVGLAVPPVYAPRKVEILPF